MRTSSQASPGRGEHRIARNSMLSLLGLALPIPLGIAAVPLLLQSLGHDQFGLLSVLWVLLASTGVFDLGLGRAATRLVGEELRAGRPEGIPRILAVCLRLQGMLGLLAGGALWLAAPWLVGDLFGLEGDTARRGIAALCITALAIPISTIATGLRGVLEAHQRFARVLWVKLPASVASLALPVLVTTCGLGLPAIATALLLVRGIACIGYGVLLRGELHSVAPHQAHSPLGLTARKILAMSGWMGVSAVAGPLMACMERLLLGGLLSPGAVAMYAAPQEALARILVIPAAVGNALFPACSTSSTRAADRLLTAPLLTMALLLVPTCGLVLACADWLLVGWLGDSFRGEAVLAFQILTVATCLNGLAFVPYAVVQGCGKPRWKACLDMVQLPLLAVLVVTCIQSHGLVGAAMAKLAVTCVDLIALLCMATRCVEGPIAPRRAARALMGALLGAPMQRAQRATPLVERTP